MALFTRTAKLDPGGYGARCARAKAVHHAVGISCQRNSGYRPNRVNIMAHGQPVRQEFMENECEALPSVAYPGVRDNRSTINTKTGYDDDGLHSQSVC